MEEHMRMRSSYSPSIRVSIQGNGYLLYRDAVSIKRGHRIESFCIAWCSSEICKLQLMSSIISKIRVETIFTCIDL